MEIFTDAKDRAWSLDINVRAIKRIKDQLQIDLLESLDEDFLQTLKQDVILLVDLLFVLAEPHGDNKEPLQDEDFARAMKGDAIERATEALVKEMINFFPSGKRQLLERAFAKVKAADETMLKRADSKLDEVADRFLKAEIAKRDRELEEQLSALGKQSTKSRASSA